MNPATEVPTVWLLMEAVITKPGDDVGAGQRYGYADRLGGGGCGYGHIGYGNGFGYGYGDGYGGYSSGISFFGRLK